MYVSPNYRTKKALKEAIAAGKEVHAYQPGGIFPGTKDGWDYAEGPHYPEPHRWYAKIRIEGGIVKEVK